MRVLALLLLTSGAPALAQTVPAPAPVEAPVVPPVAAPGATADGADDVVVEDEEIVVTAGRAVPRGSVIGDIAPEVSLSPADIRGLGVSNLAELLEEISPLTGSIQGRGGGGAPVVLLGGRRISSFREIRDLPPEAVVRVDVLPEEVALKYGYRPDQKVVNFVLRRRFEAITAEAETLQATAGGRQAYEVDLNYLRIADGSRLSFDTEYEHTTPLFETSRRLVEADPDRTLLAETDAVKLNATYNRSILGNVSATLTAELDGQDSLAGLGRATDGSQRLQRDSATRNAQLNYALNGDIGSWQWSANGGYGRDQSIVRTDRDTGSGVGRDRAKSVAQTFETEATANGNLFALPAGDVAATIKAGATRRTIASDSLRAGVTTAADLSRDQGNIQANLDVPILDDSPVGSLSANFNGLVDRLSDFGTLTTLGYGINWEPLRAVRLIASVTEEAGPPSIQQLGNPVIATPNVRVLDVTTGETVDVIRIEGGNPGLVADSRRVIKLGLTVKPVRDTDLTLLANYTDTRIDNPTASFPTATPEIEAAFPDRFERDSDGRLFRIDSRPVNFASSRQRQLRWGFNWSQPIKAPPPRGADGQVLTPEQIEERRAARRAAAGAGGGVPGGPGADGAGAGGPGGAGAGPGGGRRERGPGGPGGGGGPRGGGGFGGGGFGGGGFGGGGGRINVSLFHSWRFEDSILIRQGVPVLDLLDGSATGGRGGQPRHAIELRAGVNRGGLGARLNVDWQAATRVRADPANPVPQPQDLRFGSLTTVDLRLFADLGAQRSLVRRVPFLRGSRVTLVVDNLLNQRLDVRDGSGVSPIGYQGALLDPLGRSVRVSFRKLFF